MRDIVLAALLAGIFVYSLGNLYVGVMGWIFFSMMSPHRLAFGFMYAFPVAQVSFIGLVVGLVFDKNKGRLFQDRLVALQMVFILWTVVTTVLAMDFDESYVQLKKVFKIQLGVFISYMAVTSKERLYGLMWMLYVAVGYYGVKGGIFTIRTAGGGKVWGPEGSFIEDNNALACALLMTMPIGFYLMSNTANSLVKKGLIASIALIGVSTMGSNSRGAMIGLLAVCAFWLRSVPGKQKFTVLLFSALFAAVALFFMPQSWWDRMHTVKTYEKDTSAMGRINAWWCAFNLALDRPTGGGFNYYSPTAFALYAPDPTNIHAAHSIYFQILGDHGFVGLAIFLLIAAWTWLLLGKVIRRSNNNPEMKWANGLARMIQLSLLGYYVAGAFLSLAYYDLYWQLVACTVILNTLVTQAAAQSAPAPAPLENAALPATGPPGRAKPFVRKY